MMKKVEIELPNAVNFFRAANPIEIPPHLVMAISNSPESSVFFLLRVTLSQRYALTFERGAF